MNEELKKKKNEIRKMIWKEMWRRGISRFPPPFGRIPNFIGAEDAANLLRTLPEWKNAEVIFCNPDSPQHAVRAYALIDGKTLIMATPRLKKGFLLLDPKKLRHVSPWKATTIRGAFQYGRILDLLEIPEIDLKVCGSVAVDLEGRRIGKGHGYSEIEWGILRELKRVSETTPVVTTVHDIQVLNEVPSEPHDVPVDIIVTCTRVIRVERKIEKPRGIFWELVDEKMLEEIPILRVLKKMKQGL